MKSFRFVWNGEELSGQNTLLVLGIILVALLGLAATIISQF